MVLDRIHGPNDIKLIRRDELPELAREIREFLIEHISKTGGHLASNLGTVELTMAMHLVLDLPHDKIIWDVGHQSYTHKILTGRKDGFDSLRQYGGMSGFPKREESDCDSFDTGHSSTSISAGIGYVCAEALTGENYHVFSVIGDGAMTGGMAYEAINNAALLKKNFVIVLNDNKMSIGPNVGGLSNDLAALRTSAGYADLKENVTQSLERIPIYGTKLVAKIRRTKNGLKQIMIPGMAFENMGIMYLGPVNGHDIDAMTEIFRRAMKVQGPVLVHVITTKGKGYGPAERHPSRFHGTAPFDIETGMPKGCRHGATYTDIFSTVMRKMGDRNEKVVAVTAAMADGTGLKRFRNLFPDRFFDVGIAEEHAVTFSAALAAEGLRPVFAVYSTFLQRAYDQILHDVALQKLPVIFAVDRAGLVGPDGETHQGIFDLSYLTTIPNLVVMAPKNKWELSDMMKFALTLDLPAAIRYPKGTASVLMEEKRTPIELGRAEVICKGEPGGVLLFAIGSMVETAVYVRELLLFYGINVSIVNARFAAPLDKALLLEASNEASLIVTMEENVRSGGLGMHVAELMEEAHKSCRLLNISIPDQFIPQGSVKELKQALGLDPVSIADRIRKELRDMNQ
ncbi:MAG: 1-deoxy-D-xylulose-5-phosphate synthase [Lachnospiraceae bacterium]|nr:1-deoxy-D-xylulose-5-phosphate synthase [Lachnospiraceae bacterium]